MLRDDLDLDNEYALSANHDEEHGRVLRKKIWKVTAILTAITIVGCMYTLSIVMKVIPVGITYASFAGLCIIATTIVGIYKFNQMPDLYAIVGLILIISGVLIVNLLGKTN